MTQREAFETWAKSWSLDTDHKEKDAWGREQYSPHIHSMWQGWQAARVQALEEAAKVCEAQNPTGSVNQEWTMERCSGAIRALIGKEST